MRNTGSDNALETLDGALATARVHYINPLFMAEHRDAALRGGMYWIKTWGSNSRDKIADKKGLSVNECTLPNTTRYP